MSSGRGNFVWTKLHKTATHLIVTAVLNSIRTALTRASHSNRRLPVVVSLSDNCSCLRMGYHLLTLFYNCLILKKNIKTPE